MEKRDFQVRSAYLATKEDVFGKSLSCDKFQSPGDKNDFLFYLIESNLPSEKSIKINSKILNLIENLLAKEIDISYESFEKIIDKINSDLELSYSRSEIDPLNFSAVLGLVKGDEIHFTQHGNILGYIFRKNQISTIMDKQADSDFKESKTFFEVISGQISLSDQLVFGNEILFNRISLDRLRTILKHKEPSLEIAVLADNLKKQKAKDANAVFISVLPNDFPLQADASDIIFIDEYNEKFKEFVNKQLIPFGQTTWRQTKKISKFIASKSRIYAQKSKENWDNKYGPKTKEVFKKSGLEVSKVFQSSKEKIGPKLTDIKHNHNLGLKNVHFYNQKQSQLKTKLMQILQALSNLKILFLRENRKYLYLVIILFTFLFGFFQILANNRKGAEITQQIKTESEFATSKTAFEKQTENLALGRTVDYDKIQELLSFFEDAIENNVNAEEASTIVQRIKTILDERTITKRFFDPQTFDFPLEKGKLALFGTDIYSIDSDGKIYVADTRNKETRLIASIDESYGQAVDINYQSSSGKLLIMTSRGLLVSFDPSSRSQELLKIEGDAGWSNAQAIATYSSNIYILNSEAGQVWRHSKTADLYAKGTSSISGDNATLRGAIDIAIDGSIYILQNNGQIAKFTQGIKDNSFSSRGIPEPSDQVLVPAGLFVSENTNYLYLLDKKENRIIKFDKSGNFLSQYVFDNITIEDFAVNERLGKIWAYSETKIFEGDL